MESICEQYRDGEYLSRHPDWHAERSPWKAEQVLRGLAVAQVTPQSICDIGCGTGLALSLVARSTGASHAVGFEPSPNAPTHPDAASVVEIRREDATKCQEKFDVSMMLDVFEHVEDYIGFLRACRPLANLHVFHIPLDLSAKSLLSNGCIKARASVGHLHYFSPTTALATLEHTGFKPIHWHFTKASWEGPGRNSWGALNVLRRLAFPLSPKLTQSLFGGLAMLVVAEAVNSADNS